MNELFLSHWSDELNCPIVLRDPPPRDSVLAFLERTMPDVHQRFVHRYHSDNPGELGEMIWPALYWRTYGDDDVLVITSLTADATFETLELVFGPLLHDPAAPLTISAGASGGDGSAVPWLKFELGAVGRIVVRGLDGATKLVRAELFKEQRAALLRWERSGVMNDELRFYLHNDGPYWSEKRFTQVFDVAGRERSEVLQLAGFEWRWVPDIKDHTWVSLDFLDE